MRRGLGAGGPAVVLLEGLELRRSRLLRAQSAGFPGTPHAVGRRPRPSDRWHLDEMVVRIAGKRMYLWRAVDHEGEVLDMLVQSRGITTPVLVPLSPDGNQMNGLKAVFAAFER